MTNNTIKRAILLAIALATVISLHVGGSVAPSQASAGCAVTHTVNYGDTLYRLAINYGTTVAKLQSINRLNSNVIYVGQTLCMKLGIEVGKSYTVQSGDTLFKIARRFGVDPYVLARVNNIVNVNRIYVGQVLIIPDFTIQAQ